MSNKQGSHKFSGIWFKAPSIETKPTIYTVCSYKEKCIADFQFPTNRFHSMKPLDETFSFASHISTPNHLGVYRERRVLCDKDKFIEVFFLSTSSSIS